MKRYQLRIDGQSVDPAGSTWFETQNPYTGQAWAEIPRSDARDVDRAVQAAHRALTEGPWAEMLASQRGMLLHRLGDLITCDAAKLAETEVRDNGKLLAEMSGQLNYIPQWYYYYGGLADKLHRVRYDRADHQREGGPALQAHRDGTRRGSRLACSTELGGKSPNIVFADADLDQAVFGAISGIFAASGQTCIAGSRLLVQDSIYHSFVEKLLAVARTARMGNPMDPATQVGPVTTPPQFNKVLEYIDVARNEGATLLLGGQRGQSDEWPECGSGWFVQPTIFGDVRNDMRIAQEEVFGPVLSILRFKDEAEALAIANNVRFGLAAAVWTSDIGHALRMSEKLQAGTVWVNTYRAISYMAPFGGYKDSGLGRENGIDAIREYLQVKSVWINSGAVAGNPFVLR